MQVPRVLAPGGGEISVLAADRRSGSPRLLLSRALPRPSGVDAGADPARLARAYLRTLAPVYGLSAAQLQSAQIRQSRRIPAGGSLVVFEQRLDGVEVLGARLSLLMDAEGRLIGAGGGLASRPGARPLRFARGEEASLAVALADRFGGAPLPSPVRALLERQSPGRQGEYARYALSPRGEAAGYRLRRAARIRRVLFPLAERLVPAHYLELWVPRLERATGRSSSELWAYVISAEDGALLLRRSLTQRERFDYRVYADTTGWQRPWDSPFGDTSPDAAGAPGAVGDVPPWLPAALVSADGFNVHADPWLPAGATESRGNNVDAYADLGGEDGFDSGDVRASTTGPRVFDHRYDPALQPDDSPEQIQAVVTNLFFVNNWLHDYFYDQGFDEAAGNAQQSNLGRGGEEGDPLLAEALDFSGFDNANMSTPADGESPVMQMYRWGAAGGYSDWGLTVGARDFTIGTADFGPWMFDLSAPTVLVDDGAGPNTADACEPIVNDLSGRIALIDRGDCFFDEKAARAAERGAVGVIILNNEPGMPFDFTGDTYVDIPVIMVSQRDGADLRGALLGREARMYWVWESVPSSFDSEVVAHEWGHYLHNRLVPICGSHQCGAMGEGWGDFVSLLVLVREGDDLDGAFPSASFSGQGYAPLYFGTRRAPYSRNPAYNALSFRHISDGEPLPDSHPFLPSDWENSEVHDAGEIWASMLFDGLLRLLERSQEAGAPYDFEGARARMAGYIVTGMQMAPRTPTFTEQRDAILLAALASDAEDARLLAEAFAGRGAGGCAVSPPRESTDLVGVEEDFEVGSIARIADLSLSLGGGAALDCDGDAVLDAGEAGELRVTVLNGGIFPLAGATLRFSADDPGVEMPAGATVAVPELAGGQRMELGVPVRIDEASPPAGPVVFSATVESPSCPGATPPALSLRAAVDRDRDARSATEGFEEEPPWVIEAPLDPLSVGLWEVGPSRLGDRDRVLHGYNAGYISDSSVEIPEFRASASAPLILSFEHRFQFEFDGTYWDGGVIELSTDGGESWEDVSGYLDPGYTGELTDEADNPLSLRMAFAGNNPSFPDADRVRLDFGTTFAGRDLRFRFRVGNDANSGEAGWEIDDLSLEGSEEPVFPAWSPDLTDCADLPDGGPLPDGGVGGADGGDGGGDGGGCGCAVIGARGSSLGSLLLASALLLALAFRRKFGK